VVLVGAHYDAVPGSPGADDNGSGTAGLLEVARVLRGAPTRRTVRFVLFTLEEAGLVGSTQHVARWSEARDEAPEGDRERVAMMLSLEMIGYFKDEPGSQRNPFAALSGMVKGFSVPDRGDFIGLGTTLQHRSAVRTLAREMGKAEPGLPTLVFDHLPVAPPDLLRSDHAPYLARGLPGIIVTDTANFRNPHYHQPTDKVETLDLDRLARVTRAVAAAVWRVAGPEGEADVEWEPGAGKGAEPK
jgi:Zn-dependent M28 family amino/carboxypeptidase